MSTSWTLRIYVQQKTLYTGAPHSLFALFFSYDTHGIVCVCVRERKEMILLLLVETYIKMWYILSQINPISPASLRFSPPPGESQRTRHPISYLLLLSSMNGILALHSCVTLTLSSLEPKRNSTSPHHHHRFVLLLLLPSCSTSIPVRSSPSRHLFILYVNFDDVPSFSQCCSLRRSVLNISPAL